MDTFEKTVIDSLTQHLTDTMRGHDWYYAMSDDYSVWAAGSARDREIGLAFRRLHAVDPQLAVKTWNLAAPHNMQRCLPDPAPNTRAGDETAHYRSEC